MIFDMDGVLIDSAAPHRQSWRMLGAELGRAFSDAQYAGTFGRTSRDIIRMLFGDHLSDTEIRRLDSRKEELYRGLIRGRVPAMDGARELVCNLNADGMMLAIGSSGPPENIEMILTELKLSDAFAAVVTGADVTRGKPDPQVFLLAAQRLGISAACCAVVEDAPVGIEAARRAGSVAIGLEGSYKRDDLAAADLCVARLAELSADRIRMLLHSRR